MNSKLVFEVLRIIEVIWSEWASKVGEITKSGHFGCLLPVQLEVVPVQVCFWSFLAKLYR